MKRKQLCSLITAALMVSTLVMPYNTPKVQAKEDINASVASAEQPKVSCEYKTTYTQTVTNSIGGTITLTNTSGEALDLSTIKLDYYYSEPSDAAQVFYCDYSGVTTGQYQNFTSAVTGTFSKTGDEDPTKTDLCQIGFTSGTIAAGDAITIQFRIAKTDWSNYDSQDDDYSFKNGFVVDGAKPIITPGVTLDSNSYEKNSGKDIKGSIDYKGDDTITLDSIVNGNTALVKDTDYTVDESGNVVLKSSYFEGLPLGKNTLTFKFSNGKTATADVNVSAVAPAVTPASATFNPKKPADVLSTIDYKNDASVSLTGIYNGNKALTEGKDYTVTDKTNVTISKSYLASLDAGDYTLTYKFSNGTSAAVKITVAENVSLLDISVGSIDKCYSGDEITVPVTLNTVPEYGLLDFEFVVNYDASKFELEGVEGAGLTEGFDDSFEIKDAAEGTARIQYLISDDEAQTITKDGTLLNLKFKVKNSAKAGTSNIAIKDGSAKFNYFNDELGVGGKFKVNTSAGTVNVATLNDITVSVGDGVTGERGQEIVVPVILSGYEAKNALLDYEFVVNYDGDKLELEGVEGAGLTEGFDDSFEIKDAAKGSARIQYLISDEDAQAISKDGVLVNLKFKIKNDAEPGKTEISISNEKFNYFDEEAGTDGKFNVTGKSGLVDITRGDVMTISFDDAAAKPGEEVEVPVELSKFKSEYPLLDFELAIKYDSDKLELEGVEGAGLTEGFDDSFEIKDAAKGSARIQYLISDDEAQAISKDGVLLKLKFKVKDDAKAGKATVEAEKAILNYFDEAQGESGKFDADLKSGSVTVEEGVPPVVEKDPEVKLENSVFDKNAEEDIVADIIANGHKLSGIKEVPADKYVVSGDKVTIDKSYFEALTEAADLTFVFDDNKEVKVSVTIKEKAQEPVESKLGITVDNVTAKAGEEVEVPVELSKFKGENPLLDFELTVKYDADKLELEGVEGAGLTEGFDDSFEIKDAAEGSARIQYLISDDEAQAISKDGVLFKLKFKVKDDAEEGKAVVEAENAILNYFDEAQGESGKFDADLKSGSVTVEKAQAPVVEKDPEVKLESSVFDKNAEADIVADLTTNGYTFTGIKGVDAANYKVSENKVTIDKAYLDTLTDDTDFTFQFVKDGTEKDITVNVKVIPLKVVVPAEVKLENSVFDKNAEADIVADIIANGHKLTGIKEVPADKYVVSGDKVTIDKSYFEALTEAADLTFVFDDDSEVKAVVTIKEKAQEPVESKLGVTVNDITASAGEEVEIPLNINIDESVYVYGLKLNIADTDNYTYSSFTKGAEFGKISKMDMACKYNKTTKSALAYAVFPNSKSGIHVTGNYLFGTIKVKLNSNLTSGTVVPININNVAFSDNKGKKVDCDINIGNIIIK